MITQLISGLVQVSKTARLSKIRRLLKHPIKYIYAVFYVRFLYSRTQKEKITTATLFFNRKMKLALPASTDIYLTGGKTHDSEIRLAKYMVRHLLSGDHYLDIGAHYGYYTLLAAELTTDSGRVVAFEPSNNSFALLAENTGDIPQIEVHQMAVSDTDEPLEFHEFPNLYSEYNSRDITQFQDEKWFQQAQPVKTSVAATTIDRIVSDCFRPQMIKIDVEGGEYNVIKGGVVFLGTHAPVIAMEYLSSKRKNTAHQRSMQLLTEMGYHAHIINATGGVESVADIDKYLVDANLDSDNVLFMKPKE